MVNRQYRDAWIGLLHIPDARASEFDRRFTPPDTYPSRPFRSLLIGFRPRFGTSKMYLALTLHNLLAHRLTSGLFGVHSCQHIKHRSFGRSNFRVELAVDFGMRG